MRTVQKKGGEPSHPLKGLMSEQRTGVVTADPVKRFAKFLYRHPGAARVAHPAWLAARLRCPSVLLPGLLILSEQSRHLRSHSNVQHPPATQKKSEQTTMASRNVEII